MKLTEYIQHLQALLDEHGDIPVKTVGYGGVRDPAIPDVRYMKVLAGRERRPDYWFDWYGDERKGEKVINV